MFTRRSKPKTRDLSIRGRHGVADIHVPVATRTALQYALARVELERDDIPATISLTSAMRGDGVSFIGAALAAVLTVDYGTRVCLIDADWTACPTDLVAPPGLGELASGDRSLDEILVHMGVGGLGVIAAGRFPTQSMMPISPSLLASLLDALRDRFDHVIVALPALSESSASMGLAAVAEASALVVRQSSTSLDQVEHAVADLSRGNFLGTILNANGPKTPDFIRRRLLGS